MLASCNNDRPEQVMMMELEMMLKPVAVKMIVEDVEGQSVQNWF